MGLFNVVTDVATVCPRCQAAVSIVVQFKFGQTWQHRYAVGDRLVWDAPFIGCPGLARVVVDGDAEDCPSCQFDGDWSFYVFIEHDLVSDVIPADGTYDFVRARSSFFELAANDEAATEER